MPEKIGIDEVPQREAFMSVEAALELSVDSDYWKDMVEKAE